MGPWNSAEAWDWEQPSLFLLGDVSEYLTHCAVRVFVRVISIFLGRDKCYLYEDFSDKALHKQWVLYFSLVDVEILGFPFGLCECQ